MVAARVKRLMDVLGAALAILLLSPVLVTVALVIRLSMGSPILFCQRRPGLLGKPFDMYKFRTMTDNTDSQGTLLPDAERQTRLGRFLRSTSLDELPELLNVLRREMSLVGPRPLLMEYLDRYTPEQARRHEMRPGITGWAQVNGRNAISWEKKFELDVWYVDNWSFGLDVRILLMTIWKVIRRDGISQAGHATSEVFMSASAQQEQHRQKEKAVRKTAA